VNSRYTYLAFGPACTAWLVYPSTVELHLGILIFLAMTVLCYQAFEALAPRTFERFETLVDSGLGFPIVLAIEITLTTLILGVVAEQASQAFFAKALAFGLLYTAAVVVVEKLFGTESV
jgi:hypothetical protein